MILPIYKDRIPYRFESVFNGILYMFEIHYNSEYDFFTVDLYKGDDVVVYGEKILLNQQLFKTLNDDSLPKLMPVDTSGKTKRITYENFTSTVFIRVIDDDAV